MAIYMASMWRNGKRQFVMVNGPSLGDLRKSYGAGDLDDTQHAEVHIIPLSPELEEMYKVLMAIGGATNCTRIEDLFVEIFASGYRARD